MMQHLGALLLVEVGGAGVEHHGLDGEVLGVLLPVALLHLPLHLPDPCTTQRVHQNSNTTPQNPRQIASYRHSLPPPFPSPSAHHLFDGSTPAPSPATQTRNSERIHDPPAGDAGPARLPFTTGTTGASILLAPRLLRWFLFLLLCSLSFSKKASEAFLRETTRPRRTDGILVSLFFRWWGFVWVRVRSGALDGEARAREAAGAAVVGEPPLLHQPRARTSARGGVRSGRRERGVRRTTERHSRWRVWD